MTKFEGRTHINSSTDKITSKLDRTENSIGVSKTAANTNEQNADSAGDDDEDDATITNSRPDYQHYHTLAST